MLEDEMKKLIKAEVEKVLHPLIENIAMYAQMNQQELLSLRQQLDTAIKMMQGLRGALEKQLGEESYEKLACVVKEQSLVGKKYKMEEPMVAKEMTVFDGKGTPIKIIPYDENKELGIEEDKKVFLKEIQDGIDDMEPKKKSVPYVEIDEEEEVEKEYPKEWVKEQEGVIEKGETQVWRYGDHTLTVWMDGKKTCAQVDDGEKEELWTQKALEKVQKRIEKME